MLPKQMRYLAAPLPDARKPLASAAEKRQSEDEFLPSGDRNRHDLTGESRNSPAPAFAGRSDPAYPIALAMAFFVLVGDNPDARAILDAIRCG